MAIRRWPRSSRCRIAVSAISWSSTSTRGWSRSRPPATTTSTPSSSSRSTSRSWQGEGDQDGGVDLAPGGQLLEEPQPLAPRRRPGRRARRGRPPGAPARCSPASSRRTRCRSGAPRPPPARSRAGPGRRPRGTRRTTARRRSARIRTRVASLTPGTSRSARETVAMDTPARRATSAMLTSVEVVLDPRTDLTASHAHSWLRKRLSFPMTSRLHGGLNSGRHVVHVTSTTQNRSGEGRPPPPPRVEEDRHGQEYMAPHGGHGYCSGRWQWHFPDVCRTPAPSTAVPAASAAASTTTRTTATATVTILGAFGGDEQENFEKALAPFEEESGIDIEYTEDTDFTTTIKTRVAAGDTPDIGFFPQPGGLLELADAGQRSSRSTPTSTTTRSTRRWSRASSTSARLNGRVYGAPMRMADQEHRLVPEEGLGRRRLPRSPKTIQELTDARRPDQGRRHHARGAWAGSPTRRPAGSAPTGSRSSCSASYGPDVYDQWSQPRDPVQRPADRRRRSTSSARSPRPTARCSAASKRHPQHPGSPTSMAPAFRQPAEVHARAAGQLRDRVPTRPKIQADLDNEVGVFVVPAVEGGYDGASRSSVAATSPRCSTATTRTPSRS